VFRFQPVSFGSNKGAVDQHASKPSPQLLVLGRGILSIFAQAATLIGTGVDFPRRKRQDFRRNIASDSPRSTHATAHSLWHIETPAERHRPSWQGLKSDVLDHGSASSTAYPSNISISSKAPSAGLQNGSPSLSIFVLPMVHLMPSVTQKKACIASTTGKAGQRYRTWRPRHTPSSDTRPYWFQPTDRSTLAVHAGHRSLQLVLGAIARRPRT